MHLETLQCCAHCSLCSLHFREAGFSVVPLYNHKRHFKTTFSPKLTGKEITSSPASDAFGFQPVPHTGFVYLYHDSRFLSETGLEISASCPRWAWLFLLPVRDGPGYSCFLSKIGPVVFLQDRGLLNRRKKYANYLQSHAQSPQRYS